LRFFELLTVGKAPTAFVLNHLFEGVIMGSYMGRIYTGGSRIWITNYLRNYE
jgi:hypothetical protein